MMLQSNKAEGGGGGIMSDAETRMEECIDTIRII